MTGDSSKDKTLSSYTIQSVTKMVKIFSMEDSHIGENIKEFQEKMKHMPASFKEDLQEARANCFKVLSDDEKNKCTLSGF